MTIKYWCQTFFLVKLLFYSTFSVSTTAHQEKSLKAEIKFIMTFAKGHQHKILYNEYFIIVLENEITFCSHLVLL